MQAPSVRETKRVAGLGLTMRRRSSSNMIGSGVFLLPASLGSYGPVSLVAFGLTAVGAMLLALVFARLVLISGLVFLNYNASLVDQFTFIILLATLTTLVPNAFSAAAELVLFMSDRERFSAPRLVKDAVVASLALAYALWTIAGSGYQVVFRGFMLLMLGIPVYIYMKWRAAKDDVPEPAAVDLTPVDTRIAVGVGE